MLNDRDEKYETPEDSEYHFSDDDISYEVEPETAKPAASSTPKENIFNRLSRSRRMLISLGVFLVLVFVVYKMVAPSGQTTPSDITPVIQPVAQQPASPAAPSLASTENPPPVVSQPPAPVQQPMEAQAPAPQQPVLTQPQSMPPNYNQVPANAYNQAPPNVPQTGPTVQPPGMPAQSSMGATAPPTQPQQQPMLQPPQQQVVMQPPVMQPNLQSQQPQPQTESSPYPMQPMATTSQPQVVPVQTIQQPIQQPVQQPQVVPPTENVAALPPTATPSYVHESTQTSSLSQQIPGGIEGSAAQIRAQNEKLIAQLQAEYVQRINEYANQNKNLNEQMQQLNSRVANMETEMHKLLQTLTKQLTAPPRPPAAAAPPREVPVQVNVPRIAYNVQAIIPGRAWLRSDNGDTVTVAEGDLIKNVGRVVKIDPYDGVVEINTGTRVISLSYGNGG